MGKSANVGGGQAKAEPKRKASEKDKAESAAKAAPAKAEDSAAAKTREEAQQKWADDDRDERWRVELRDGNRAVRTSGWTSLNGNRDKSIAKVTRFQNKLKGFKGESELSGVLSDIDGVDASKYVSELAECIMEAGGVSLKLKDLSAVCKVCSKLHATYEEFGGSLAKALEKAYRSTQANDVNRRRFLVRLCVELCLVEITPAGASPLLDLVKELTDIAQGEEQVITNFTIVASVVQKHAVSCLGILPSKQKQYEEALGKPWVERQCLLNQSLQAQLLRLVVAAYQSAAAGLLDNAHSRFIEQEKVNQKLRIDKGAVDEENEKNYQTYKENYQKLQATFTTLSDFVNQPMPSPQEEAAEASRLGGAAAQREDPGAAAASKEDEALQMIWEDGEQQRFYEEVTDLKQVVPGALLNPSGKSPAIEKKDSAAELEDKGRGDAKDDEKALSGSNFEVYLMRVGKAEKAQQIDALIIEFFHDFNTKGGRRALAVQLLGVSRKDLHLLAPHARFIAIIAPFLKDVANYVLQGLQAELEQQIAEKDPNAIDARIKTVRYLCELCKFKICPPGVILDLFKTLLDNFAQHDAELCANLLLACGRFLLYTAETAARTENLLERMMRLKNAKAQPVGLDIMLEDAYYQMKPPEWKRAKAKEKDPLELFLEHVVYERLYNEEDEDKVLKLVRKIPWTGHGPAILRKCILELNMHANYESIYLLASLLSGLAKYRDAFVIETIDALLESVQATIERNDFREMPLRVRQAKLIGELYNYRLIDSNLVFDTLYHFIGFGGPTIYRAGHISTGHRVLERALASRKGALGAISEEVDENAGQVLPAILADPQHPLEPPWDFFRIKLVCVVLDTCGHYFERGAQKQKLDRFLQFFLRYVVTKGELPLRVEFMVSDTLERMRPKMALFTSKAEADEAILKLLQSEREHLDLSEDEEKEAEDAEEESSSEEDSSSGSDDDSSDSDDSDDDEDSSEDEDDAAEDVDYDRGAEVAQRHTEEIDDFDKEVQQILIESIEREQKRKTVLAELPAPPAQKRPAEGSQASPNVFSLLQKPRGGKLMLRQIEIPQDSKLSRVVQATEEAESTEREELKRLILHHVETAEPPVGTGPAAPLMGGAGGSGGGSRHHGGGGRFGGPGVRMHVSGGGGGKGAKGGGKGGKGGGGFDPRPRRPVDYVQGEAGSPQWDSRGRAPPARTSQRGERYS